MVGEAQQRIHSPELCPAAAVAIASAPAPRCPPVALRSPPLRWPSWAAAQPALKPLAHVGLPLRSVAATDKQPKPGRLLS
jgi:hypothetical protein